jgi:hypothetical protein
MTEPTQVAPRQSLSGGTGIALSLVVSLLASLSIGAFTAGGTSVAVQRLQTDATALQARLDASVAVQNAQALELATLKVELRAIRESQLRVEAALDRALVPGRGSSRSVLGRPFTP